jgi:UDP:flavonoid glycosyltransferase YjiC (YdhE family)
MKTLVFAVAGYNLAETGRMIEIAREARRYFDVLFISYGGRFETLIEKEGFALKRMEPRLSEDKLRRLQKVLSGQTLNTMGHFTANELRARMPGELALFEKIGPAAILTGWCLSVPLSARAAKIPFVNVLHSTSIKEYYEAGLQSLPDRNSFFFFPWFFGNDEERMNRWVSRTVLNTSLPVKPYNEVGSEYGLPKFGNLIALLEGDHTLLADIPEWVGFKSVRPNLHYIGPLPARLDLPVPDEVAAMPHDKPIVYFAMGSSGKPKLIAEILRGFSGKPYRVIAPVKSLVEEMDIDIPDNVVVTGFLPAHKVNAMADISVIHGGQNTVMNACLAGTPIVGIGMHPEQQANLDACVRKGFAIRLNKKWTKAADVLAAINRLLADKEAKKKVLAFKLELEKWNGPENAANFLKEAFG